MINLLRNLLTALVLTVVAESIPLLFCRPRKDWLTAGLLCNCATNPTLNILRILFYSLCPNPTALLYLTIILEVAVVFVEAWLYRLLVGASRSRSIMISLLCNSISLITGILILN